MNWGPGDRQTFPGIITTANDPDYEEWDETCSNCDGTGLDNDGEACDWCEDGLIRCDNVGERRR